MFEIKLLPDTVYVLAGVAFPLNATTLFNEAAETLIEGVNKEVTEPTKVRSSIRAVPVAAPAVHP